MARLGSDAHLGVKSGSDPHFDPTHGVESIRIRGLTPNLRTASEQGAVGWPLVSAVVHQTSVGREDPESGAGDSVIQDQISAAVAVEIAGCHAQPQRPFAALLDEALREPRRMDAGVAR